MEVCKNCGGKLIVKSTQKTPEQLKKAYYYSAYYFCPSCKKLYHDDKFKVINTPLPDPLFSELKNSVKYDIEIWTDGACVNNGKPNARAAWGFVSGKTERAGLLEGVQTNNRAEAFAIYHALVWAAEKGFRSIKLHTDSQISIHGVSKDPSKVLKNRDIFEQIAQVIKGTQLKVDFIKVLGHSGDPNNERVDKLANLACRQADDLARTG
jgi:ribonuclease HI